MTYCLRRCLDLFLKPAGALLVDGQELFRELLQQLVGGSGVDVHEPLLVLRRKWNLVVRPLARL